MFNKTDVDLLNLSTCLAAVLGVTKFVTALKFVVLLTFNLEVQQTGLGLLGCGFEQRLMLSLALALTKSINVRGMLLVILCGAT
jgi:hypothetical protein